MNRNGPSEFFITGSLKDWDIQDGLHKIKVPCLLVNGKYDEGQDGVMQPFFDKLGGKVKWIQMAESSHTPQLEETGRFVHQVNLFLES